MVDRKPTPSVALPQELLDEVDREAKARSWNRSLLIREAIKLWLRLNGQSTPDQRAS